MQLFICAHLILAVQFPVQFSRSVVSDSLRPHELQHARPPCPSPTPGVQLQLNQLIHMVSFLKQMFGFVRHHHICTFLNTLKHSTHKYSSSLFSFKFTFVNNCIIAFFSFGFRHVLVLSLLLHILAARPFFYSSEVLEVICVSYYYYIR